jgi:hypothetical protein
MVYQLFLESPVFSDRHDGIPEHLQNLYRNCFSCIDFLDAPIRTLRFSFPEAKKPETLSNGGGDCRSYCASIDQGFSLIAMHLAGIELAEASHDCFPMIR